MVDVGSDDRAVRRALHSIPEATVVPLVSNGLRQWLVTSGDRDVGSVVGRVLDEHAPGAVVELSIVSPSIGGPASVVVTLR